MVTVNGENLDIAGKTIAEYVALAQYNTGRIAIELNCEIVPKANFESTVLKDGDHVEVVRFVGGG